jgi:hypothetical protein
MIGEGRGNQKAKSKIGAGETGRRAFSIFHITFVIAPERSSPMTYDECNMENGKWASFVIIRPSQDLRLGLLPDVK